MWGGKMGRAPVIRALLMKTPHKTGFMVLSNRPFTKLCVLTLFHKLEGFPP